MFNQTFKVLSIKNKRPLTFDIFLQIEVLVPPAVQAMPRVGKVTVRKGKDFTLRCAAKGNPNPTISWSKEVKPQIIHI